MDASGLLGCFYGTSAGQTWVSSSAALLSQLLSHERAIAPDTRKLHYDVGFSWFTPPRSRFQEINRLLPSQILDLRTGNIRPRRLLPTIAPSPTFDETMETLKATLVTAFRRLSAIEPRPWLGLTSGFDSRLILAIARDAGVKCQAVYANCGKNVGRGSFSAAGACSIERL
jgi:hypothetical protein